MKQQPMKSVRRSLHALAQACALAGLLCAAAGAQPQPQPTVALRPAVAQPLQEAQKLIEQKQPAQALTSLQALDAVADKTPAEVYLIERVRALAAQGAGNNALVVTALAAALATGQTPAAEKPGLLRALAARHFQLSQFAQAAKVAQDALDAGVPADDMVPLRAQALFSVGEVAEALGVVRPYLDGVIKAGRVPRKDLLEFQARCHLRLKDNAGYDRVLEQLLTYHPSNAYWDDLLGRMANRANFPEALLVDVDRLRLSLDLMTEANDYLALAQQLLREGFPSEAAGVIDRGFSAKVLGVGSAASQHEALRAQVRRLVEDDKKVSAQTLGQLQGKSAAVWFKTGLNQVYLGDTAAGVATMRQALSLPGGDLAEYRLRLGASLWHSGAKAEAAALFRALASQPLTGAAGTATELARLWALRKTEP